MIKLKRKGGSPRELVFLPKVYKVVFNPAVCAVIIDALVGVVQEVGVSRVAQFLSD